MCLRRAPARDETRAERQDDKNNKRGERDRRAIKKFPSQTNGIMRSIAYFAAINIAVGRNSALIRVTVGICKMSD